MRKIVYKTVVLAVVIGAFISCGKEKKEPVNTSKDQVEEIMTSEPDINVTEDRSQVKFADNNKSNIYAQYLRVKAALVNSNAKKVQQEAGKLDELLKTTEPYKALKATANLIKLTNEMTKQRDFFVALTQEIENMVNTSVITSGEVYKQFCPMAFDGKGGYWLSDSKEIRNPFYGDKMLKCGRVEQVIK